MNKYQFIFGVTICVVLLIPFGFWLTFAVGGFEASLVIFFISILGAIVNYILEQLKIRHIINVTPSSKISIPEASTAVMDELCSNNFNFIQIVEIKRDIFRKSEIASLLVNEDKTTIVIVESLTVSFTTYFSDGLAITTLYPDGDPIQSDKIKYYAPQRDLHGTLDFHYHQLRKFIRLNRKIQSATNLGDIKQIEDYHNHRGNLAEITKMRFIVSYKKGLIGLVIACVTTLMVILPIELYIWFHPDSTILNYIQWMYAGVGGASFIVGWGWITYYPHSNKIKKVDELG
ncbi:MAG: hypothetical protein AAF846_17585 [Chloroflexota bacterium]